MDDDVDGGYTSATPPPAPPPLLPSSTRALSTVPAREDCWSEHATQTLIDAWGDRFLDLNRGHLRHNHWQEVADAVNAVNGRTKKTHRSDVQCKNRIDTLKKKYKVEKFRVSNSDGGGYVSDWPFFPQLDHLIGPTYKPSPASQPPRRKTLPVAAPLPELPHWTVPVGPRSKRPVSALRSFSTMAAAAAAAEAEGSRSGSETSKSRSSGGGSEGEKSEGEKSGGEWYGVVAEAIERVGEMYGRVEEAKQRQMVELEKQRMQFAKDLEVQRMRIFMDAQIQLEKIKRAKKKRRSSESDSYL